MTTPDTPTRLNKHLALQLGVSRREADILIAKGQVTVDGTTAILGARIAVASHVAVDGKELSAATAYQYIAFHKPTGYVCSRKQQGDNPTIYDLIPAEYHHLKPVGRLDRDSSGLLLLTNDGDFAYHMTHPKFYKVKVYEVTLDRELEPLHQQMINDYGVQLDDGPSQFIVECLDETPQTPPANPQPPHRYRVTMHEGRNRQIRRTFTALGYTVVTLHRTHFGSYALGDIKPGTHEVLNIS